MVVKLNGKPIRVREKEDDKGIDWLYIGMSCTGLLLLLWVVDLAALSFLGVHAFPLIKYVGVILQWLRII